MGVPASDRADRLAAVALAGAEAGCAREEPGRPLHEQPQQRGEARSLVPGVRRGDNTMPTKLMSCARYSIDKLEPGG